MVVIDDFRKQILYQRLNLGYDCTFCRKKFYSKHEQLQHLRETHLNPLKKKEHIECPKCGKVFGHLQIYQLHLQIHTLSESDPLKSLSNTTSNGSNQILDSDEPNSSKSVPVQSQHNRSKDKQKPTAATQKKTIGLTKIKMEDCLRCDACSCIYIDQNDYYKHMRNFHKVNNVDNIVSVPVKSTFVSKTGSYSTKSIKPNVNTATTSNNAVATTATTSPQKKCRSCCRQCRDNHYIGETHNHHNHYHQLQHNHASRIINRASAKELFKFSMQDNIKDRWSKMVSHRLIGSEEQHHLQLLEQEQLKIKPDPDATETGSSFQNNYIDSDEMTHLLSQVEVKIKTEPPDER